MKKELDKTPDSVVVSNDKHTIHNLLDYHEAKTVVQDFPRIIKIYEKLLPALYHYAGYQGVWPVIRLVEDSKLLLELQLDHYSKIYKNKGLLKSENTRKK